MGKMHVKDLCGYREPTNHEVAVVGRYMVDLLNQGKSVFELWFVVYWLSVSYIVLAIIREKDLWGCNAVFARMIGFCIPAMLLFLFNLNQRLDKKFVEAFGRGNFAVLDCYGFSENVFRRNHDANTITIKTMNGQCCVDEFAVDAFTSSLVWSDKDIKLILVRCRVCRFCVRYELLSVDALDVYYKRYQ